MTWLVFILLLLLLFIAWLLIAPLVVELDTDKASCRLSWGSIGSCSIYFENEWWLEYRVLFYQQKIRLVNLTNKPSKKTAKKNKKPASRPPLHKMIHVLQSFTISKWRLAADTGDASLNARLYALNFLPACRSHVHINFAGYNYAYIKITNRPWKMIWAFLH
jgi:hypothetical protein